MLHQQPKAIHRFGASVPEMLISGGDIWIVVEVMANRCAMWQIVKKMN